MKSELQDGINLFLRYIQYALFPVAALLLWRQLSHNEINAALTGTVAGVVGMVPEGLVLLTSLAFGLAAVSLARRKVLVQELPAVEGLARVDVVCLDKTGTLTEGDVAFDRLEPVGEGDSSELEEALGALADDENRNATLGALAAAFAAPGWKRTDSVAFSSARKWSAATFEGHGSWVFGAPEMVLAAVAPTDPVRARADELAAEGRRVLVLARADGALAGEELPSGLAPVSLVLLEEKIRPDAAETLAYFTEQGVALKVISGDNPRTVGAVARRVGLPGADQPFDARELPEDQDELADVLEEHSVFGRVTPQQKRAMVGALQSRRHVVAMTGDGVNDALALKDADIGIAMRSGAAATRAVAQLVLLDDKFATMPGVVAEGRRVIANIERSANLFVTKTVYAILLAVAVVATGWRYPFLPTAPDDRQHVHHRHPRLLPRARPELAALRAGLRQPRAPVLHPGRNRRGDGLDDRVWHRALRGGSVAARGPNDRGVGADCDRALGPRDPVPTVQPLEGVARRGDGGSRCPDPCDSRFA